MDPLLFVFFLLSLVAFVLGLVGVPLFFILIPPHFFKDNYAGSWLKSHHPVLRIFFLTIKNLLGATLILAGIIMLFTPGQGLITLFIGIVFTDFPGKKELEFKILKSRKLQKKLNRLRRRFKRPPLEFPDDFKKTQS